MYQVTEIVNLKWILHVTDVENKDIIKILIFRTIFNNRLRSIHTLLPERAITATGGETLLFLKKYSKRKIIYIFQPGHLMLNFSLQRNITITKLLCNFLGCA